MKAKPDTDSLAELLDDHGARCAIASAVARGISSKRSRRLRPTRSRRRTRSPTRSSATISRELKDELGDLLFQVVFHARMAEEAGAFAFADVARRDLRQDAAPPSARVRRPASRGQRRADEALGGDQARGARALRPASGVLDDVPVGLPALTRAAKLGKRAATVGFDWPDVAGVRAKVDEELAELDAAAASGDRDEIAARDGRSAVHDRELVPAPGARSRDLLARRRTRSSRRGSAPSSRT